MTTQRGKQPHTDKQNMRCFPYRPLSLCPPPFLSFPLLHPFILSLSLFLLFTFCPLLSIPLFPSLLLTFFAHCFCLSFHVSSDPSLPSFNRFFFYLSSHAPSLCLLVLPCHLYVSFTPSDILVHFLLLPSLVPSLLYIIRPPLPACFLIPTSLVPL